MHAGLSGNVRCYLKYVVLVVMWIMFEFRNRGASLYLALNLSALVIVPLFAQGMSIGESMLLFCSLALVLSTAVLMRFDFGQSAFFCFIHMELIECLTRKSLYSMVVVIAETVCICYGVSVTRYVAMLLGMNLFACLSICIVFRFDLDTMFSGGSTFLAAFLSIVTSKSVNVKAFLFSCFFSLPRLPLPIPPQALTDENRRSLMFAFVSFCVNIVSFSYGVKYKSMAVQSGALKSVSNNAAMVGAVLADLCSRIKPNPVFRYGYGRTRVICKFTVSILLLYFSYERLCVSLTSLISHARSDRIAADLFIVNVVSFLLNVGGVFFLGTINPTTCTLSEGASTVPLIIDLSLSTSELLCTILSFAFGITVLDSYVSLATSVTLLMLSIPRLRKSLGVLLEQSPVDAGILYKGIPHLDVLSCEAWELTSRGDLSISIRAAPLAVNPRPILKELMRRAKALKAKYTSFEVFQISNEYTCL